MLLLEEEGMKGEKTDALIEKSKTCNTLTGVKASSIHFDRLRD